MASKADKQPNIFKIFSVAVSLSALLLASCAQPGDSTAAGQPAACGNKTTTTLEGTGVGAAVGALAGGLIGKDAGGALAGGAIGGLLGTGAGYAVANKNCNQATSEADLQQQISVAQQETARYQEDADYYSSRAAYAQRTAARLQAEYNAGKISAANYRAQMQTFINTNAKLQNELAQMQASQQRLAQQAAAAGPNGGPLSDQAQQQASTQQQLQKDFNSFSNTLAEVPQG